MSTEHRKRFFDGVAEHSRIKLRALERYLRPWAAKVGSIAEVDRVWVVDCFAGPGTYASGEAGSPLLALEEARWSHEQARPFDIACLFADKNGNHARQLRSRPRFRELGVQVSHSAFHEFARLVPDIVQGDPALVFVDPFGLGDLKFDALRDMCGRISKVDLIVNFASPAADRLAKNHASLISEAIGSTEWTPETITDVFLTNLERDCSFLRPACLPVPGKFGQLQYQLVLASRHRAAYELWNEEISTDDRAILDGPDEEAKADRIDEAAEFLRNRMHGRSPFGRDQMIRDLQLSDCGMAHSRVYKAAVTQLIDRGTWTRAKGPVGTAPITPTM